MLEIINGKYVLLTNKSSAVATLFTIDQSIYNKKSPYLLGTWKQCLNALDSNVQQKFFV